mgnify:CR=1 FL=1|tara:strand:+ start:2041 stop:2925 length:885 start_codon:yes stop_codon:yes gene_type:complete
MAPFKTLCNKGINMEITAVTTFHYEGMLSYGQRFLDSWAKNVDQSIKLLVYAEDCTPVANSDNIIIIDAKKALPKLVAFKNKWGAVPKANGIPPQEIIDQRPRDHHKKFKWDAVRFANKVYAVFDAVERSTDWLVWVDADTYVHSPWSREDFVRQLPNESWITFVGRGTEKQTWPECGFYGLNLKHTKCQEFLAEFERMYEEAELGIFKLREWHDSYVFGHILNIMRFQNPNVFDYSAGIYIKTAKTGGGGHPLINTELGRWIDHMKGGRKGKMKSSVEKDLMTARPEAYWNEG